MKKFVVGFCAALALAGSYVAAQDWDTLATISSTLGVSANRLCIGEGFRISDIGCPAYAPTVGADGLLSVTNVSASGGVSVTGTISADKFIGDGSELSGISVDGDRITSGTLAVIANSETSYVSLSTAGTTWGYLGNANSFLPRLGSNHVSSSLISTTYMQLNSATTIIACGAQFTGAMRYISGTMQVCDGNEWRNVGIGVPGITISAFEAATCPSGWSEYTPARGRFLRGMITGQEMIRMARGRRGIRKMMS